MRSSSVLVSVVVVASSSVWHAVVSALKREAVPGIHNRRKQGLVRRVEVVLAQSRGGGGAGGETPQATALWLLQNVGSASDEEFEEALSSLQREESKADALSIAMGTWASAQRPSAASAAYMVAAAASLETRCSELASLPRAAEALTNTARSYAIQLATNADPEQEEASTEALGLPSGFFSALAAACADVRSYDAPSFMVLSRSLAAAKASGAYTDALLPFGERAPAATARAALESLKKAGEPLSTEEEEEPFVLKSLDAFLTTEESAELLRLAEPLWSESLVQADSVAYRTSETASLRSEEAGASAVVAEIRARAAAVFGLDASHCESLQLVRYHNESHYYKPHCDLIEDDEQLLVGGQRLGTVLVYISAPEKGGETAFGDLKVTPKTNTAIAWSNVAASGAPDLRSRHEALPIDPTSETPKIALNCWIRAFPGADAL